MKSILIFVTVIGSILSGCCPSGKCPHTEPATEAVPAQVTEAIPAKPVAEAVPTVLRAVTLSAEQVMAMLPAGATMDVLSTHVTVATFQGTKVQKCLFRTAECPDRCTHGGVLATFNIDTYTDYKKPGEYGDAKTKVFMFRILEKDEKTPAVSPELLAKVQSLKVGDRVNLSWEHIYVKSSGSHYPERIVTKLSSVK